MTCTGKKPLIQAWSRKTCKKVVYISDKIVPTHSWNFESNYVKYLGNFGRK